MILTVLVDPRTTRLVNSKRYDALGKEELSDLKRMAKAYISGGGSRPDAFVISGDTIRKIPTEECRW